MSDTETNQERALWLAAQCWCDPETETRVMDPELAQAFAKRLAPLMDDRDQLKARVRELDAALFSLSVTSGEENNQLRADLAAKTKSYDDCMEMIDSITRQLVDKVAQAEAWYQAHTTGQAIPFEPDRSEPDDGYEAHLERCIKAHEDAVAHAHALDPKRRSRSEISKPTCGQCGLSRTLEGHDGCLGTLPDDVMNACCGHHGHAEGAYIQYGDGVRLGEDEALREFKRLGVGPDSAKTTTPKGT